MHYLELSPPPALASVIRCFWFLRSDQVSSVPQPVVADGRFEIVLHAAEPFARLGSDGRLAAQGEALVAGQLTAPLHLVQRGSADVVGIRFRTGTATAFLRHPLHELTNQVERLELIDRRLRNDLLRALSRSGHPVQRRDALSAVLLSSMGDGANSMTRWAIRAMDTPLSPRLQQVARSFGTTTRTLERRIAVATGLSPRSLSQTMRFRRVYRGLQEAGPGEMTRAALDAGYFDQAHCIREFRRFTGLTPSAFFGQDPALASALVASVQSPAGEA